MASTNISRRRALRSLASAAALPFAYGLPATRASAREAAGANPVAVPTADGSQSTAYRVDVAPSASPLASDSAPGALLFQRARLYLPVPEHGNALPNVAPGRVLPRGAVPLPWRRLPPRVSVAGARPRVPAHRRVLVLLHGLGETRSPELGLKAWGELYGLEDAMADLLVQKSPAASKFFPQQRALDFENSLRVHPFEGMTVACPLTPNPKRFRQYGFSSRGQLFDAYADWLEQQLLPEVRRRTGAGERRIGLDGCSMGGYVATEVFLRRPRLFSSFGCVQSAIGKHRVPAFTERLKALRTNPKRLPPMQVLTSERDPFRGANQALARSFQRAGADLQFSVLPGPHNQPWLRRAGTYEVLRFHDAALR